MDPDTHPELGTCVVVIHLGYVQAGRHFHVVAKRFVCRHVGHKDGHASGCSVDDPLDEVTRPRHGDVAERQGHEGAVAQNGRVEDVDAEAGRGGIFALRGARGRWMRVGGWILALRGEWGRVRGQMGGSGGVGGVD